jgi:hypothetical protein
MKAKVTFHKLIQDTQDLVASDPNQNHMVSRAFFTLDVRDKQYADMSVTLRQPFGTDYAKEPIEVSRSRGFLWRQLESQRFQRHRRRLLS